MVPTMKRLKPIARDGLTVGGEQHGANRATNDDDEQYCFAGGAMTLQPSAGALWHHESVTSSSRVRDAKFTGEKLNFFCRVV
jgi:hypothetical protein